MDRHWRVSSVESVRLVFSASARATNKAQSAGAHDAATAVDGQRLAGDERGVVRSEKGDGFGDLVGGAGPAQGVRRARVFQKLLVGFVGHTGALVALGDDHARINGVDAHALRRQF